MPKNIPFPVPSSTAVKPSQRFSPTRPCPICGGHARAPKGSGARCWGFASEDGLFAHCTRAAHAGALTPDASGTTYTHRLACACACGVKHTPAPPQPRRGRSARSTPAKASNTSADAPPKHRCNAACRRTAFEIRDASGELQAVHQRIDHGDGTDKSLWWCRAHGKKGLGGRRDETLPLYGTERLPDLADALVVVTEGEKAADALYARGIAAVGTVTGVRGTPCDDALRALLSQPVILWPDADADGKGREHMLRIADRLRALGHIDIRLVDWQDAPAKGDAADFSGSDIELDALIDTAAPYTPAADDGPADGDEPPKDDGRSPYSMTPKGTWWRKGAGKEVTWVFLCNFRANITADVIDDDGAEQHRRVELAVSRNGSGPTPIVTSARHFHSGDWIADLGANCIVSSGSGARDRLREAIQVLSATSHEIPTRHVFSHTGWRKIAGGAWVYLHAAGAIGANGVVDGVDVALDGALADFVLPTPPAGDELRDAVRADLELFEHLPLDVAAPLGAAAWGAPLCEPLEKSSADFSVWFVGPTGAHKTSLAMLGQAHFSRWHETTAPASFESTGNFVERLTFLAKDSLLLVDDYRPANDRRDAQQLDAVATRLARGAGNRGGRGRLRSDTTVRPPWRPRGITLATAERLTRGVSTSARLYVVHLTRDMIALPRLSAAQKAAEAGTYQLAMSGYIQWLAGPLDVLRATLPDQVRQLREQAQSAGSVHTREPGQIAHLALGIETYLKFAVDVGAVTQFDANAIFARAWAALVAVSADRRADLAHEDPATEFVQAISTALAGRRAYLAAPDGAAPEDATRWGWEVDAHGHLEHASGATLIGWVRGPWIGLLPAAAYTCAVSSARARDRVFGIDERTLCRQLADAGLIATQGKGPDRRVAVHMPGVSTRVLKMRVNVLIGGRRNPKGSPMTGITGIDRDLNAETDTKPSSATAVRPGSDRDLTGIALPLTDQTRSRSTPGDPGADPGADPRVPGASDSVSARTRLKDPGDPGRRGREPQKFAGDDGEEIPWTPV